MIPRKVFFTKGVGKNVEMLHSFEMALRDAGIEKFNLVCVSSIMPPGCKIISRNQGLSELTPGQIVFCVMARNATNEPNRLLASSIGCAIPADQNAYGYLSEHHPFGETEEKAGAYAEGLAATMLASTLGLEIKADKSYDEQKKEWMIQDKIVRTTNMTQSAIADKNGLWTTVLASAVFICDEPCVAEKPHITKLDFSQNIQQKGESSSAGVQHKSTLGFKPVIEMLKKPLKMVNTAPDQQQPAKE